MKLWEEFENMNSNEAIFVSIVDRIQPLTLNICSEGKIWITHGVTVDKVLNRNRVVLENGPKLLSDYVRGQIDAASENRYFYNDKKK